MGRTRPPTAGSTGGTPPDAGLGTEVARLARRHGLAEIYAFGSRGREVAARVQGVEPKRDRAPERSTSDVDVGIRPLRGTHLDVEALVRVATELEHFLDVSRVDVVLLPTAGAFLALEAIRGELLYCADPDAQAEYELYVLRRAGDLAPFQRLRQETALSRYLNA